MSVTTTQRGEIVVIKLNGNFSFQMNKEFKKTTDQYPANSRYEIDLSGVDHVESSALGMLLVLRSQCGDDQARITLTGANPRVRTLLEISQFHKLFELR
ncbi:MAG: STAS domain-containing protein [Magnetococcales bacterium]|nr:STAS domain-containing protein [Magnetococcales bacterium]